MKIDRKTLEKILAAARKRLLDSRTPQGFWIGQLSSSALSTATAVFALATVNKQQYKIQIHRGLNWLCANCNSDGGWGDTVISPGNISTTMLCWAAFATL